MSRGFLFYDDSVRLPQTGLMWRVEPVPVGEIIYRPEIVYCEFVSGRLEELCQCPVSDRHVTGIRVENLTIELFGGHQYS